MNKTELTNRKPNPANPTASRALPIVRTLGEPRQKTPTRSVLKGVATAPWVGSEGSKVPRNLKGQSRISYGRGRKFHSFHSEARSVAPNREHLENQFTVEFSGAGKVSASCFRYNAT
jgi:hypothetical protein